MSQPEQEAAQSAIGKLFSPENLERLQQSAIHLSALSDVELSCQILMHELMIERHRAEMKHLSAELKKRNKPEKKPRGRPSKKNDWDELIPLALRKFDESPELSEVCILRLLFLSHDPDSEKLEEWVKTLQNQISVYRKNNK